MRKVFYSSVNSLFYILLVVMMFGLTSSILGAEVTYPKTGESPQTEKLFQEAAEEMKKDGALLWYDSKKGVVVMRGGEEEPVTWVTFRAMPERYYPIRYGKVRNAIYSNVGKEIKEEEGIPVSNAGHFTIYHYGHLLIDTDVVKKKDQNGRQKERSSCELGNYNTIVVDDEDQLQPGDKGYKPPCITALEDQKDFAYICADLTGAYRSMERFTRQFVYLRPTLFVIFDRVKTTEKLGKAWTLNFIEEPLLVKEDTVMARTTAEHSGQIFVKSLLPPDAVFVKRLEGSRAYLGSWVCWRTEWQPKELAKSDIFLHVFFVSRTMPMTQDIDLVKIKGRIGVEVNDGMKVYRVLFDEEGESGGQIRIEGEHRTEMFVDKELTKKVTK